MIGRRSVWSDDRIIEFAKNFVPCTDEVYRLQRGQDPECKYFQQMAEKGHYGGRRGQTRQGIYVCSADGKFLSSINSNSADAVLKTLEKGLAQYQKLPRDKRATVTTEKIKSNFRWEQFFPSDGLALAVYSRDLPADHNVESQQPERWNRDSAWYHRSELKDLIPQGLKVGDQFAFPDLLSRRLLRMNFVDTVRGQTDPFAEQEIEANIQCVVTSANHESVTFSMSGETKAESTNTSSRRTPRGVVTKVKGEASWSWSNSSFDEFELIAAGYRWGRTRFNGRGRGPNISPLGFVVTLAPKEEAPNVPGLVYAYERQWLGGVRSTDGSKRTTN